MIKNEYLEQKQSTPKSEHFQSSNSTKLKRSEAFADDSC